MLSGTEYERWYCTGALPEREWTAKEGELKQEFLDGKITLEEFEEELDVMLGRGS